MLSDPPDEQGDQGDALDDQGGVASEGGFDFRVGLAGEVSGHDYGGAPDDAAACAA